MTIRKRRSDRSGRAPLPSPGRPQAAGREERGLFWAAIAAGLTSEDAAVEAGVSQPVGTRWFRKAGGMPPAIFSCERQWDCVIEFPPIEKFADCRQPLRTEFRNTAKARLASASRSRLASH
jgi:hypothetical protein